MSPSTFKAGLFVCVCCLTVFAQNPEKKIPTSTISGQVTLKGNGTAGVAVGARLSRSKQRPFVGVTDAQGNYRITNVTPGTYEILPTAPQFTLRGLVKTLIVGEGESYDGIDFALVRGGVITGRLTDGDGKPIIEEGVFVSSVEGPEFRRWVTQFTFLDMLTDDRGVYRFFGLAPGKYRVWAGSDPEDNYIGRRFRKNYQRTFHPSTTDIESASFIEVAEGSEVTNIDITLRRTHVMFNVSGRIVDGQTGRPQPNVSFNLTRYRADGSSSTGGGGGMITNGLGEFKIESLAPGQYSIYVNRTIDGDTYVEPAPFEVIDQDVNGVILKVMAAGSISGSVVLEGVDDVVARTRFPEVILVPFLDSGRRFAEKGAPFTPLNADGSFKIGGLGPGVVTFSAFSNTDESPRNFVVTRIERNGEVVPRLEIKEKEQISGIRVFVRSSSGAIRGVVKFENGSVPAANMAHLSLTRVGDEKSYRTVPFDARGRFFVDKLDAGVYELSVSIQGPQSKAPAAKQQVAVFDDQVIQVTLTLKSVKDP